MWAIERANLDAERVAKVAPKFDEWLTGDTKPTLKQLEKFASATFTPLGYLLLDTPPDEPLPVADYRTFVGAAPARPSPNLLDTIYACEQRQEWYRNYALQLQFDPLEFVGSATVGADVAAVAETIRETLDFEVETRAQYPSWTAALSGLAEHAEAAGILVMINGVVGANTHRKLDPKEFRGFSLVDDLAPVVFVNGADTKAAQIFTLAHEIAHIWLGESGVSNATVADNFADGVERWCNRVAAELLVPRAAFSQETFDPSDLTAELERLAKKYRVSTLVILMLLRDVGRLSVQEFRQAYEDELARVMALKGAAGSGGNFYNTQPIRVSKHFARAVITSALEGNTLHRDAFRLLGVKKMATFNELVEKLGVV